MNNSIDMANEIWKEYQQGINYFRKKGLDKEWEDCENFYEGNQWPQATKRTKAMPRPVINVCSMIADNKKAGILSGKLKMIYQPAEMFGDAFERAEQGADLFTRFAEYVGKELKQDKLDDEAQSYATQLGSYVYHYYWDTTISGGMQTPYVGGLRAEMIHPKNFIVHNPMEYDVQKQKYIIIASCEPLASVIKLAKKNKIPTWNLIGKDTDMDDTEDLEISVCTVLTKYYRENGKVVWVKTTQNSLVTNPTYWQPDIGKVKFDESKTDEEEVAEPDKGEKETDGYFRKQLYPVVFKYHKKRNNCAYGIGEIIQSIPNNKAINFSLGMMLLSVQQTAWPKMIQKIGALANQQITNEPGEIVTDYTKGQGWGVKYLETPGFNSQTLLLTDKIIDLTRTTTGSTEVVTGEVLGANMAASAIIALQNQAKKPIEMYQKGLAKAYEEIGKIYEQFFKYYYNDGRMFSYTDDDNQQYVAQMYGSEYQDIDYSLSVEVGQAGTYSDSLTVSLLDNLVGTQTIDMDDYIELYPDNIMTFKPKLKRIRQKRLEEMQQQLAMQQAAQQGIPQLPQQMPNDISQNIIQ